MSTEEKLADLITRLRASGIARLRASGTANAPRNSDGIYMSICDEAASAISRLSAEVQELREALRPFAEHDVGVVSDPVFTIPDEHPLLGNGIGNDWHPTVTVGDFRRARTALSERK